MYDDIGVSDLHKYFSAKLCDSEYTNDVILEAERCVQEKYDDILNGELNSKVMSEAMVKRYIKKLHLGSSPGIDGIVSEHLKYAINSGIARHLSVMLSLCLRYGIVPISFTKVVLVPLLKKPTLDPSVPNNYRPVTISSTFSKLLEVYILEVCGHHDFNDLQFGFISGRGTNIAVSLVNDVISYCTESGSPVYTCSLDAQGAFDAIPHPVLFRKAIDVLPDHC